ncbi:RNA-splicing factor [Malassezia caprae]|uniref:RNA-splicing factor n=1 Tax=Malassezia caprae TaxID=1381934 RepID=A0AAF0E2Y2_9BASI|nr:RNA-splicing factor [Malassezia caprae]
MHHALAAVATPPATAMYNGIGLQTARGSGTNGYVQKNLSHLRPRDPLPGRNEPEAKPRTVAPDVAILDHERRRKIELQCLELQDELEERGLPDDEVRARVDSLRQGLRARLARAPEQYGHATRSEVKQMRPSDTHARGAAKARESESMQRALRINPSYVEGQAFDPAWQERRKLERHEARAQRHEARAQRHRAARDWGERPREASERPRDNGYASRRAHVAERERAPEAEQSPPRDTRVIRAYDDEEPVPSRTPSPPPLHSGGA